MTLTNDETRGAGLPACPQCYSFDTKSQDRGLGCLLFLICALATVLIPIGVVDIITFFAPVGAAANSTPEVRFETLIQGIVALAIFAGLLLYFFVRKLSTDLMECKTCGHKWDQRKTPGKLPVKGMPF
jgi:hypothetical protein